MPDLPVIRRLGPGDLKSCMALAVGRGWLPEKRKWVLLLDEAEVFGIDAPDGGLAGSVTLARYGDRHASVGMMLVAARYGRRGLGHALMTHLLDAAGGATVTLFATDMGRPLYEKLGFQPVRRSVAFTGAFRPAGADAAPARATVTTRAADAGDLPSIVEIDRAAFGADRSRFVRRLPSFADRILVSITDSGGSASSDPASASGTSAASRGLSVPSLPATPAPVSGPGISGYACAWSNGAMTVIGPVIAPDGATARRLITDLAAAARGPVRLDLDPDRPELPAWAEAHGLPPTSLNTVMAYGPGVAYGSGSPAGGESGNPVGGQPRIFAPITVALS